MTRSSFKLHIIFLLALAACLTALYFPRPTHAGSGQVCFSDGCVYFAEDNGTWLSEATSLGSATATMQALYNTVMSDYGSSGFTSLTGYNGMYYSQIGCYNGVIATTVAPPAPTGLSASCSPRGTQVTLSWTGSQFAQNYPLRVDDPNTYTNADCSNSDVDGPNRWCPTPVDYANETAYSGITLTVIPRVAYRAWVHAQNPVGWSPLAETYFTCTNPPATCSVTFDQNPIPYGSGTYLRWSSSNANYSVYINNIGYVGASGSTWVGPRSPTDYSCYANGSGGSDGWHVARLSVYPPTSCLFNGQIIANRESVTAYQSSSVSYGSTCASQPRICINGTLSGSYAYSSCSVEAPASCTQDGVTVAHGSSYTFYSAQTAPQGQLCSSISQSRTCTNGVLSGSSAYQYASCSCVARNYCTDASQQEGTGSTYNTITSINAQCGVTYASPSCVSPAFCSAGSSSCLYPPVSFTPFTTQGGDYLDGHLYAQPILIRSGFTTKLYWNVDNAAGCTVSGGSQTWNTTSSGSAGQETAVISEPTTYILSCTALSGAVSAPAPESVIVNILPVFLEN